MSRFLVKEIIFKNGLFLNFYYPTNKFILADSHFDADQFCNIINLDIKCEKILFYDNKKIINYFDSMKILDDKIKRSENLLFLEKNPDIENDYDIQTTIINQINIVRSNKN